MRIAGHAPPYQFYLAGLAGLDAVAMILHKSKYCLINYHEISRNNFDNLSLKRLYHSEASLSISGNHMCQWVEPSNTYPVA